MQLEIARMAIDNPKLRPRSANLSDPEQTAAIGSWLNLRLKQLELSYSVKAITSQSVRLQARIMFAEGYPVEWWRDVREIYEGEAATRREQQFFVIVDDEHEHAMRLLENTAPRKTDASNLCETFACKAASSLRLPGPGPLMALALTVRPVVSAEMSRL